MSEKRFTMYKNEYTLIDKLTGHICEFPNQKYAETCCKWLNELSEENEQLKSYIDTIFEGNSHICKRLNVEDVQFYCERNRDYHYPTCTYKKCFDENDLIELKEKIRECNE